MDDNAKIYLDDNGNYHDNTEENRELYPPASTTAELAQESVPEGEPVPFTDEGKVDTDAIVGDVLHGDGTGQALPDAPNQTGDTELVVESGSDVPPVAPEPDAQPPASAKTRKA